MGLSKVVFDVETVGFDFDSLEQSQKDYLLKHSKTEDEINSVKESLGLYPLTGKVVVIAMYNVDTQKGKVLYTPNLDGKFDNGSENVEGNVRFIQLDEYGILSTFWEDISKFDVYITFNGRAFDIPFIRIRSAILGIKCSRDLMTPRFKPKQSTYPMHIDLLEEFTFQGILRRFNLDFYCKSFGIKSPKEDVSGKDVSKLIKDGKGFDVAKYCYGDVLATAELFLRWDSSYSVT